MSLFQPDIDHQHCFPSGYTKICHCFAEYSDRFIKDITAQLFAYLFFFLLAMSRPAHFLCFVDQYSLPWLSLLSGRWLQPKWQSRHSD